MPQRRRERRGSAKSKKRPNRVNHSKFKVPDCWRDILGNKELTIVLHKVELQYLKKEEHLVSHDEPLDYAIKNDDTSLMKNVSQVKLRDIKSEDHDQPLDFAIKDDEISLIERIGQVKLPDIKSDEHVESRVDFIDNGMKKKNEISWGKRLHRKTLLEKKSDEHLETRIDTIENAINEEDEIPLNERLKRIKLVTKKWDKHLDTRVDSIDNAIKEEGNLQNCIEKSEPVEVQIEPDAPDLEGTKQKPVKRELRVILKNIRQQLETRDYVNNLRQNTETFSMSSRHASSKRKSNNLSHDHSLRNSSCMSVKNEFLNPVSQTTTEDVCEKTRININNTLCTKLKYDGEVVCRSMPNDGGKRKRGRKPKSIGKVPDEADRSVKYDHNLNVVPPSSKQELQQGDIKISPTNEIADPLVLNTSKDTVTNINTSSTSNVSSTFHLNDDWKPEFKNTQCFGKEELSTELNCDGEKINDIPLKVYYIDEQKEKVFKVDNIATTNQLTIAETSSKSKTSRDNKSVKKVRVRNNVVLTGNSNSIQMLNEDTNEKQAPTRNNHIPNSHDKVGVSALGDVINAIEAWNVNINYKKTSKPIPKSNIAIEPTKEYETNGRNNEQKNLKKSLVESPDYFRDIPLQKNTKVLPITASLEISDTETCHSSQGCQKSGLGDVESLSNGSKIGEGDNKTVVDRKRKFKDTSNLSRSNRNTPKKLKLNRLSWQNNKADLGSQTSGSSDPVSPGSTHMLSPLNDLSSSTEVSRMDLNFYAKRHTKNEFGRPVLKNSFLGPETSKNLEVKMVASDSIESCSTDQPTRYSPISKRQTSSDKPLCSKQKSTQESDIKKFQEKGKPSPNAKRQTISDVQTTVDKSEDSKLKLNAEANMRTTNSVKSRLGPRTECESKNLGLNSTSKVKGITPSSVKSRLGPLSITSPGKSTTKAITSSINNSPVNVERSMLGSPYTYPKNEGLKGPKQELQQYKIPKISRDSINESLHSNSQRSQTSEACSSNVTNENIDDEDYICLHPEESFSDLEEEFNELASKKASSQVAESFSMTDSVFDRFMTKNRSEFDVQYENSKDVNSQIAKEKTDESLKTEPLSTINVAKPAELINNTLASRNDHTSAPQKFFLGTCFYFLRSGFCRLLTTCRYNHDVSILIPKILTANWTPFMNLITYMAERNYWNLLQKVVKQKLWHIETNEILSLFQTIYNQRPQYFHNQDLVQAAVNALRAHRVPLKDIISKFLTFISDDMNKRNLFGIIREHTPIGTLWDTTKDLVLSISDLSTFIVQEIMRECVESRPENADDVNARVVICLTPLFRATLRRALLASFESLLEEPAQTEESAQRHNNPSLPMSSQSNEVPIISHGMSTHDQIKLDNCLQDNNNASSPVRTNTQSVFSQSNISYMKDDNNNLKVDTSKNFVVKQIDNLPVACSIYRNRFSKFYGSFDALRQALNQKNYEFVIQILDYARKFQTENTFYTLSCYRILCQEVKLSAHHMNKIRSMTVQMNVDFALRKSLGDITKCILIRLADEGLYMLAYTLLENWKELMDHNASLSLLMAEIYLGCDQPLEALYVLKRHNIIHSNRCKWTVPCDSRDEYCRAKLLPVLLKTLSITNPDYALYLFEFLAHIQSSNFQPIDLTRCVDALVSSILLTEDMELIERAGRLIFAYNIPLAPIIHRALIATAISEDVLLARQLYRAAISRGIYSSAKFQPTTHIIIDSHCSLEEVYLALSEFMQDILANIGPALDRLTRNQIPVYIFVESIRSHEQTDLEETNEPDAYTELRAFKNLVRNVLETRFEPPMKLSPRSCDKILKLQPKSLLNYLRAGHL